MSTEALFERKEAAPERGSVVLIFLGPPGAGKGTHAAPLSERFQIPHISTGALFREHIRAQTPLGEIAQEFMHRGRLLPDELVSQIVLERLKHPDCAKGYILDGFPRTVPQAEFLKKFLHSESPIVLNLDVPDEILVERITGRLSCARCMRPYHRVYNPPKGMTCDDCHGTLSIREDDREEVLRTRLEVYRAQTAPLIDFYREELIHIDGKQPQLQVFEQILNTLRLSVG